MPAIGGEFHTFLTVPSVGGIVVPQAVYQASVSFEEMPSIQFVEDGRPGVSLNNALRSVTARLEGGDVPINLPDNFPLKVQLRILWPGYPEFTHSIVMRKANGAHSPITKADLSRKIANAVEQFLQDNESTVGTDNVWDLHQLSPSLQNLRIYELRRVAHGSCQPVLVIPTNH